MPSIHYLPTQLVRTLPDGTPEELCFVLVVDEDMHMTVAARTYRLSPATGGSQIPTSSTRFPPNADFVSSPMGIAILNGELTMMVGRRIPNTEVEVEEEKEKKNKAEEEEEEEEEEEAELGTSFWRWLEHAGTPLPAVEQVLEEGERAWDAERDSIITNDYPEEYVEEHPRGPPSSPTMPATTHHLSIPPHAQRLSEPSFPPPPSAPRPRYISKFFPQPDIRSLTIAERRVRTRLTGKLMEGQTIQFPPDRINVALAEGFARGTIPGLPL